MEKDKKVGKLNGEAVYLNKDGKLCLKKDHRYLRKMNAEEKCQFFEQKDSNEINIASAELTTLKDGSDE